MVFVVALLNINISIADILYNIIQISLKSFKWIESSQSYQALQINLIYQIITKLDVVI